MLTFRSLILLIVLASFTQLSAQGINVAFNVQDDVCESGNGCIESFVTGGVPPYSFLWQPEPAAGQGTSSCCGLVAGLYTLTVTDSNGSTQSAQAPVYSTPGLLVDTSPGAPGVTCIDPCSGYWMRSMAIGGVPPYSVIVEPPAGNAIANANGIAVFDLCVGETYAVTITDANSCTSTIEGVSVVDGEPPVELSRTLQGICQGFSPAFAQITFDQNISQVVVVSGTGTLWWSGAQVSISNLANGTNVFRVIGATPLCMSQFVIDVLSDPDQCGSVEGVMHADADADCLLGAGDPTVPFRMVGIQPGNFMAITLADGSYSKGVEYGAYSVTPAVPDFGTECIDPYPVDVTTDSDQPTAIADLLLSPQIGPDASATVVASPLRPGLSGTYVVMVRNNNAFPMTDIGVTFNYDQILGFSSATATPTTSSPGEVEWLISSLAPFETFQYQVVVEIPPDGTLIGVSVLASVALSQAMPDARPVNDHYAITSTIVGAVDPNDKLVQTSSNYSDAFYFNDVDEHIDYTIRFQNTGTAEAIDVYILDTISPLLDLASFELLGASHTMVPSLLDDRVLRFDFPNILLPDSNANEPASHGFVSFRMKPEGTLEVYEEITNAADIYFDFNAPVRTNTTVLTVDYTVGIAEQRKADLQLAPNPVDGSLQIISPFIGSVAVDVFDMEGRSVLMRSMTGTVNEMDVSALAPGVYVLRVMDQQGVPMQARFVKR